MENKEAIERRKNDLALADLVGFLGGMVLIAGIVFLLLVVIGNSLGGLFIPAVQALKGDGTP